ncbi:MAG: hypothetical protein QM811_12180 [Pirellulales bacterium]
MRECERAVTAYTPVSAAEEFSQAVEGRRALVVVPANLTHDGSSPERELTRLREQGHLRVVADARQWSLDDAAQLAALAALPAALLVAAELVVDRITTGPQHLKRNTEAIAAAFTRHPPGCEILACPGRACFRRRSDARHDRHARRRRLAQNRVSSRPDLLRVRRDFRGIERQAV